MHNLPLEPPCANPVFHPKCKIFSVQKLERRAQALGESGLAEQENAIFCAVWIVLAWPKKPQYVEFNFAICPPEALTPDSSHLTPSSYPPHSPQHSKLGGPE